MVNRLELTRGAYGAVLLAAPQGVATRLLRMYSSTRFLTVLKVLGVRQITQSLVTMPSIANRIHPLGAAVDVLHSLSMLAVAAASRTYRRAALIDAIIAATFATFEFRNKRPHF